MFDMYICLKTDVNVLFPNLVICDSMATITRILKQLNGIQPSSSFTHNFWKRPLQINFHRPSLAVHDLLTFLSCSTRGGSRPQVMICWICLQGPAAMLDNAQAASFCTLAFGCLISWGRMFRTPASTAIWVCRSEPLTMLPMERRAGVCRSDRLTSIKSWPNV